jgi:hypothetical protein
LRVATPSVVFCPAFLFVFLFLLFRAEVRMGRKCVVLIGCVLPFVNACRVRSLRGTKGGIPSIPPSRELNRSHGQVDVDVNVNRGYSGLSDADRSATVRRYIGLSAWVKSLCDYLFSKLERGNCCSFAYSTLACFRMGMSGSASFQRVRKSW